MRQALQRFVSGGEFQGPIRAKYPFVRIVTDTRDSVLKVPNAALRFTPTNGAAGPAAPGASKSGSIVSSLMPRPPVAVR